MASRGRLTMRHHLIRSLVMLTCCLLVATASADEQCPQPEQPWTCFGTVEIVIDAQPPSMPGQTVTLTIRYSWFANDEFAVDIEAGGEHRSYLRVHPADIDLYSGLTEAERASWQKNPFLYFDIPLAGVLQPLTIAFPDGPATISRDGTQKTITADGRTVTFVATQIDADHVSYRVADAAQPYSVRWSAPRLAPRPDRQSLAGWTGRSGAQFATLGEARMSRAPR
jgi:hypothetical protein